MTKDGAQLLLKAALDAGRLLDSALAAIQHTESDDEFKHQRRAVGEVLGAILFEILNPIIDEHPDLTPDGWQPRSAPVGE